MKLSTAVEQFIQELRMGKAANTAAGYNSDLVQLVSMARPNSILAFTEPLVTSYFLALSQQGSAMSTLHRKAACLKNFARWGVRKGLWKSHPMDDPKFSFRRPEAVPRPFDQQEIKDLLELQMTSAEEGVFRALLYYTGLRVTPACTIKVGDVSFLPIALGPDQTCPGTIRTLNNKGRKTLVTPMVQELKDVLQPYLQIVKRKPYEYVLQHPTGRPWHRKTGERITKEWGSRAGVADCTPHRFRHQFATDMLAKGVDIRIVQKLMGHADIKSTLVYTKVSDAQLVAGMLQGRGTSSTLKDTSKDSV